MPTATTTTTKQQPQCNEDLKDYGAATTPETSVIDKVLVDDDNNNHGDIGHHHSKAYSHTGSTMALCLCTLTHSYLLISVFPYSGFMAMDLVPGVDEENVGSYAGLVASMFMIGRTLSSYIWGKAADTYGRTFVLYFSLVSSGTFTLLFGLSPSFGLALFWRFCLGLGNGILGTAKTAASELAKGDEKLESKGVGWVIGMWGWGFLVGPALGGVLAEPVRQYDGFWNYNCGEAGAAATNVGCAVVRDFLSRFPFFLPNLVGAILCLSSVAAVRSCVEETLPKEQTRALRNIPRDIIDTGRDSFRKMVSLSQQVLCRIDPSCAEELLPLNNKPMGGQDEERGDQKKKGGATMHSIWARKSTRHHLLVYWASSLVATALDEIFPLFCMSQKSGLGLSEGSIGKILSSSGILYAVTQFPVYNFLMGRLSAHGAIRFGLFTAMPLIYLVPAIILVNHRGSSDNTALTPAAWIFSSILLALYRVSCLVFSSNITIATNRTVPASDRATMNGFSMLGDSAVKGVGPFLAGCLFALSVSSDALPPAVATVFPFAVVGTLGLLVAAASTLLANNNGEQRQHNNKE